MGRRIREFIESIVFAGLKPGTASGAKRPRWFDPIREAFSRFLSGSAPTDPLYLTNRPLTQRLKLAAIVVVPCLLIAAGLMMALSNRMPMGSQTPSPDPTPAEITQKILPHLDKNIRVDVNRDLEVMEIHLDHSGEATLTCSVRNNTAADIPNGEVVIDLTDASGSQLGAVTLPVSLRAHTTKKFQTAIKQSNAAFGLVREVHAVK